MSFWQMLGWSVLIAIVVTLGLHVLITWFFQAGVSDGIGLYLVCR